jgi:SpoVK/Ycf46/Vps4 family AAA+-type ATPase
MSSGKLLRQVVRAGTAGDQQAFREASEALIREEREKQHHLLANDLEGILYGSIRPAGKAELGLRQRVPTDQERGLALLDVREPTRGLDDVVLADANRQAIESILEEHRRVDLLRSYGLRPVQRLLFYGPPGCGKTLTAEVLATELGRPLALVRVESVVSSFLGETSANLRKVFDFIEANELVALFDEFDAIGKERADASEHGELKRVVNAFLQMLDGYQGKSLIVAATNHEQMLDSAIWRRFDETLRFERPSREQLAQLLRAKLRGVRRGFEPDSEAVLDMFGSMSHAQVERVLRRAIKAMVLRGQEFLEIRHLETALGRENTRRD